jgi:hypothetical protein
MSGNSVISNCVIEENRAGNGGGVYVSGAIDIGSCTIRKNIAKGSTAHGGGVYGGSVFVGLSTSIEENEAQGSTAARGGGVYANTSFTIAVLNPSSIASNTCEGSAAYGGGVFCNSGANAITTSEDGTLISNTNSAMYGIQNNTPDNVR